MDGLTRVAALIKRFREITSGEKRSEARERAHPWKMNLNLVSSFLCHSHTYQLRSWPPQEKVFIWPLFLNMLRTAEGEGSAAV